MKSSLLSLWLLPLMCLPTLADTPPVPAVTRERAVLDHLAGKPQIVGVTTTSGTKFLGSVIEAKQGVYLVQTFHFVGTPQFTPKLVGSGRNRHWTWTSKSAVVPDVEAVEALLAGDAGPTLRPQEKPDKAVILAASDIKFLQALSPPAAISGVSTAVPVWTLTTLWPLATDTSAKTAVKTP